ncbi:ribosomal protein S6 kinase-related protein isoform X2 [Dicentrarchus labrax]|uniref:ribosomal protein S6 kinase-related protein isoform X2 n=1 Tax=Dicentrarchus labrax TaxID=13489 RepID=UPI0021F5D342|nr:ribosomal protein S6 kinase-related protein isoform X2 [Dicentrarchus labrax]
MAETGLRGEKLHLSRFCSFLCEILLVSLWAATSVETVRLGHSAVFSQPAGPDGRPPAPKLLLPPEDSAETSGTERTPPAFVSVFLPEFPQRQGQGHGQDHFQILGFIAKGSYGPILKVKDIFKDKTFAVKVLPKSEILKHGVVEQSKEEVIIQRQLKHPFIHNLQDCWQTQRHLFIMCDYCSVGDLYTYWLLKGQFGEDEVQLFAAELGSALGHLRLSDFGLSRRLKRGGRAFTICGTIQYMEQHQSPTCVLLPLDSVDPVMYMMHLYFTYYCFWFSQQGFSEHFPPEVLSGGPYNHAADWWSLGIMLFSLVTGEFPVPAEPDHSTMFHKVKVFPYVLPETFSSALLLLLTELLCKNPANRLRNLESFKMQPFFRGASFDSLILQKTPVDVILQLRTHPDWTTKAMRGLSLDYFDSFDCNQILNSPTTPTELSPGLTSVDPNPATEQTGLCFCA